MVSRRLLRIKTLQICYAYLKSSEQSINQAEKELFFSIQKFYDLYHYLILLVLDISDFAEAKIELSKLKRLPSEEDLNPNTKFINNRLIKLLKENEDLKKYLNDQKLNWVNYPELIKNLYNIMRESEIYLNYMSSDARSFNEDKKFISDIFLKIIINHEPLYQNLEEQSIFWNDDTEFVIGMIMKSIKSFKASSDETEKLMTLFTNEEDRDFVKRLFRKAIINHKEYQELVAKFITNWDVERVAFMDIVVMSLAVAEMVEFSEIPIKVSLDEYIEIAKFYSTQKSNVFINGILDKIIDHLKKEGKIKKIGRGLISESK
ncbi:MAG: transcription antitermination factor NusB [Bacteroidales bacterium]|nr:transcription antitermination factor NusB [Bacteroidales bacterium]